MNRKSLAALAFASLFISVPLLGTEKPAQAQLTKEEAEERLVRAIGLFRMAVAAENKLINWYPADQDDPKVEAIATDYCGNLDHLTQTSRNLAEIANLKNKTLLSDPDISDRVKEIMRLEETFTSESRQLRGMGFSVNSNPSSVDPDNLPDNSPRPLLGTEKAAQAQLTKEEAEERLDIAIGLFRMAVAAEDKLINWYPAGQDDPKVEAIARDYCGNLDLLMETSRNLAEIANLKNKALLSYPDISDRVREIMRLEETFTSDSRQLRGMGFSCPANSNASLVDPLNLPDNSPKTAADYHKLRIGYIRE
jgi:membrane protease subunit (stomatin/prohibitin family)